MARKLNATFLVVAAMVASLARPAPAGIHQAWDEAHFVKVQTIEQIDQILDDIHARFGKDLMIETFASIPDDFKPNLEKEGKDKFYAGWTRSEAYQLGVNGVIILITGDPKHLQVEVGRETQTKAFTLADRDELIEKMADAFKAKDYDNGLLGAAQFVRDRMARNLGGGGATPPPPATQPVTSPSPAPAAGSDGFGAPPAGPAKQGS